MAEQTTIRPGTLDDLDGFLALHRETGERLERLPYITFVAIMGDKIVGAIGFSWPEENWPIAGPLMVSPAVRAKKRLVHRLVKAMEDWIAKAGVRRYLFEVDSDNGRMLQVAQAAGAKQYAIDRTTVWYMKEVGRDGVRTAPQGA